MTLPATGPTTRAAVKNHLGIAEADVTDDASIDGKVAAVNAYVRRLPVADSAHKTDPVDPDWPWDANVVEGATMLAARLWRRKDTPGGVVVLGDAGAVYIQRNDPDVALLLGLGEHGSPAVG